MSTYFIADDADGEPTLWEENPNHPSAPTFVEGQWRVAPVVWHATTAVLAPSEHVERIVAEALCSPSHREGSASVVYHSDGSVQSTHSERLPCLMHATQARTAIRALAAHADGAAT